MMVPPGRLTAAELLDLQLREHLALDALAAQCGRWADVHMLAVSVAVARELAAMGYGVDQVAGLEGAAQALSEAARLVTAVTDRHAAVALPALRWFLVFHDAQRYEVTRREYCSALARVRARPGICLAGRLS